MAALMTAATTQLMVRSTAGHTVKCSSPARLSTTLRPAASRRAVTVRAEKEQQTDSRDSYQVQLAHRRTSLLRRI